MIAICGSSARRIVATSKTSPGDCGAASPHHNHQITMSWGGEASPNPTRYAALQVPLITTSGRVDIGAPACYTLANYTTERQRTGRVRAFVAAQRAGGMV